MQLPQWLARFNRYFTNRSSGCGLAGRQPWASSTTSAESRASRNGVAISLAYGPNRDRLKNVVSPAGGRMRRDGKTFELTDARVMPRAEAAPSVKVAWQPIFAPLPFEQAVLLKRV
jgi:hypothetical protein